MDIFAFIILALLHPYFSAREKKSPSYIYTVPSWALHMCKLGQKKSLPYIYIYFDIDSFKKLVLKG
jgi:hypothetical protein